MKCDNCDREQNYLDPNDYYHMVSHPVYTQGYGVEFCNQCYEDICVNKTKVFRLKSGVNYVIDLNNPQIGKPHP